VFNDIILLTVEKDKKYLVELYAYYDRINIVEAPTKGVSFCPPPQTLLERNPSCGELV